METNNMPILIVGAGPAGLTAALTLNKLGHKTIVIEKSKEPKYKVGESLLPGSLSILDRLGLNDVIKKGEFIRKPSATFAWGNGARPFTFSFSTSKEQSWIYDHAIQINRCEFEGLLMSEAINRGVEIRSGHSVTDVDLESNTNEVTVQCKDENNKEIEIKGSYMIDASGIRGLIAKKYEMREYDDFYRSMAMWTYYKGAKTFDGDLEGTTFSITFQDGWIWIIPLKDDVFSVGVIVDYDRAKEIRSVGRDKFFHKCIESSELAKEILDPAEQCDKVRQMNEWSYDASSYYKNRSFLCGDSACFTDPLFSQGVYLSMSSAALASSSIDYILKNPEEQERVQKWYDQKYRSTYLKYHEFLVSFYTYASNVEGNTAYWGKRKVSNILDSRLDNKIWFSKLKELSEEKQQRALKDLFSKASNMVKLGLHPRDTVTSEFSDDELNPARIMWIAKTHRSLNRMKTLKWIGEGDVKLTESFEINPITFKMEKKLFLTNGKDILDRYSLTENYLDIINNLQFNNIGYKELIREFKNIESQDNSSQLVIGLLEADMLRGYDKNGEEIDFEKRLRFSGVGLEHVV